MLGYPFGWMTAAGLFFLCLFIAIAASPVTVSGQFSKQGKKDDAEIAVKALFGLYRYRMKVPVIRFVGTFVQMKEQVSSSDAGINKWKQFNEEINADDVMRSIDKFKQTLEMTRNLTGWAKQTLAKVKLTEWKWHSTVGTGDAMWTAMATGLVWSTQSGMIGVLSQFVQLKSEPKMNVTPIYNYPCFSTEWSCIAQIRFGYAILAGLKLLVRMKKGKGGVKAWQNILFRA